MGIKFSVEPMKWRMTMRRWVAAGSVAALSLGGCTNQIAKEGQGDVIMRVAAVNGGAAFQSDVQNLTSGTRADQIEVVVAVRSKNPFHNETNYSRAVFLERYEIRYYRSDGRNTQGVEVPYNISGDMSLAIDVGDSDKNAVFSVEFVRLQAKQEPPLRNLICRGSVDTTGQPLCGQADTLTVFAEVTFYGRQVFNGNVVTASGRLQIDFADYADEE